MSATEEEDRYSRKRRTDSSPDHSSSTRKERKYTNDDYEPEHRERLTPDLRYHLDKLAFYVFLYGEQNEKKFVYHITSYPDLAKYSNDKFVINLFNRSLGNKDSLIRDYYEDKKSTLMENPGKYVPKYIHFPCFIYSSIHPMIGFKFKAAGVIPYCCHADGTSSMLLGCEDRTKKQQGTDLWCYFGGKKVEGEKHPAETALRELTEETAHIFSEDVMSTIKSTVYSPHCAKVWYPAGKFVLFFVCIAYDDSLPSKFLEHRFKKEKELSVECDQTKIAWIPTHLIADALSQRQKTFVLHGETMELYRFFVELMNNVYGISNLLASDFTKF